MDIRATNRFDPGSQIMIILHVITGLGDGGAEAGTYFLDKKGLILSRAKVRVNNKLLGCSFDFKEVLNGVRYVSGKAISSRHFEPMGTKTVQILLEGDYNGILQPDIHYLAVKKDLSNFKEKVAEFNDPCRQNEITNLAFEYAMDCHTYRRRVDRFIRTIFG